MKLSPSDHAAVLELTAEKLLTAIRSEFDLAELMTVPVSMVSQLTGLSRSQVERTFTLRPMGKRRNGVSMKQLQKYTNQ
jgi:hypothetical protein